MKPDPKVQPLVLVLGVMIVKGLLHGDCARDGIDCTGKDHHEPVPEALDLVAATALHRAPEQTEIASSDTVRGVVSEPLDQFRGTDQVGEQEGDCSSFHGHAARTRHCLAKSERR